MSDTNDKPSRRAEDWHQASHDARDALLPRASWAWPGLLQQAARVAWQGDIATRDRSLQTWPEAVAELFEQLRAQPRELGAFESPGEESPREQTEAVLRAVYSVYDEHLQRQVPPATPYGLAMQWRARLLHEQVPGLALKDPRHAAWPVEMGDARSVTVQLLLHDADIGPQRAQLRLRLVPATHACLTVVPAPANALTFLDRAFAGSLATVTRLLHRWLRPVVPELRHLALEWNLFITNKALLALQGDSAGAAFAMAALWLLQDHLPDDGPADAPGLRRALAGLPQWLLGTAGISIAVDEQGQLRPVGQAPAKARAYGGHLQGEVPLATRHLFLHPDNDEEVRLDPESADLPGVQLHPVSTLPLLLQQLAQVAQPRREFSAVLAQMPLSSPRDQDDLHLAPPAAERERLDRELKNAWREHQAVRDLRDYFIVRWAHWAQAHAGELHMRFVPLALSAAPGAESRAHRLPPGPWPGLAALLSDVHDADTGEDRVQALLLQGQAGAGKSTLLQRHEQALALDGLRNLCSGIDSSGAHAGDARIELPLYLSLAGLDADEPDPAAWARTHARRLYPAFDELHQLLQGQRPPRWPRVQLRLLLDGLNELPVPRGMGRFQRAERVVHSLCEAFHLRLAPLLSARGHHGFDQLEVVQRGACVQVQHWPADLVRQYIARCFTQCGAGGAAELQPAGQQLLDELAKPAHRSVLDLCATPFNAAAQVKLWAGGRRQLVRHRADLYARLLHQALLRELALNDAGQPRNPDFHDPALITEAEREYLQEPANWRGDEVSWPELGGSLLPGLFRQALAQWVATDRPPEERGTVEVPWNHPHDPQRSVAHGLPEPLRRRWLKAVRDLGLLADDPDGRNDRFRFRHQSWGEYLASVRLLEPTPQLMPAGQLGDLLAHLQHGRSFDRSAQAELDHQREQADREWWEGAPGKAWWQALLNERLTLDLSAVKRELGWPEVIFAEPEQVPTSAWGDWQYLRTHQVGGRRVLELHPEADQVSVTLRGWGDLLDLVSRYGRPGQPWTEQAGCVRAFLLQLVWTPWQGEVRRRLAGAAGPDRAKALWRSTGALSLPEVGSLDEVLGLALLALPPAGQQAWLRWLVQQGLWVALRPAATELQRLREAGATAWAVETPCGVLQHLRRVLLLRQLDAGASARSGVQLSGQWALLASHDDQCDPALAEHWRGEQQQAFHGPGRDLRERLQAAELLGLLGDNLRYEQAPADCGSGLRIKPGLWAGVGVPGRPTAHRIGAGPGDAQALPGEQPAFDTVPPLPYFQVARLLVTCAEWRAFVQAGGYDPAARHWQRAGPAAQRWLRERLQQAGVTWDDYQPEALGDARWGWALNPITTISVYEAVAYAHWAAPLYAETAGAPAAPGQAAWATELPNETWWEAAQRAGADGLPAPVPPPGRWGAMDYNHAATGWNSPSPVGLFSAAYGPAGQADARGNVWEWCANALPLGPQPYGQPAARRAAAAFWNGTESHFQTLRALRGGAFDDAAAQCRPSYRLHSRPDYHGSDVGVRLVRVWPPHSEP